MSQDSGELEQLRRALDDREAEIAVLKQAVAERDSRINDLEARVARLEHLLGRNSGNSSMPPSRDGDPGRIPPVKPKPAGGKRKKGKQPGARGTNLAWREHPTTTLQVFPQGPCDCGRDLGAATDLGVVDRYQQHEIPVVPATVTQYDQHEVRCGCGRVHAVDRPVGARPGPVGYGPNLQAMAVYLMVMHHIPTHRCAALLEALTGAAPSVGFVHGMLARTARLLDAVDQRVRTLLTMAYVVCCDETPIRVGGKTPAPGRKKADRYLLVACTELYTHYLLGGRDLDTFKNSVIAELTGVVVHDRYVNYDNTELGIATHQLCLAHLLRDLAAAAETYPDAIWPGQCADTLRELIHHANTARGQGHSRLSPAVADPIIERFRHGVRVGVSETRHRGDRPGEAKAAGLLADLRDREQDVLRFVTDLRIPPTNNQAERDARPAKIQQNISGRLTSENRTADRYLIRGVLSTVAKHGRDILVFLRDAFTSTVWAPPDPIPA